jgi:hypothetical protein
MIAVFHAQLPLSTIWFIAGIFLSVFPAGGAGIQSNIISISIYLSFPPPWGGGKDK